MSKESEKSTVRIDISKTHDEKQTPSNDPKVDKTELGLQELEERVAPLRI
ncbi:MAG TPA: hypothetical protein VL524_09785 [Gemmatimonadaceae bacterium]|jgi:hypothetical protein|nr:hypothetical protein [Gemmatimonadaceae bacterium]